jgi:hypothetical protein
LGPYKIKQPNVLGNNNFSVIIAELANRLSTSRHIFYLNNLFINIKLLRYIRERGFGITSICTTKSGILKDFYEMKTKDTKKNKILWGILYHEASEDELI